MNIPFIDYSSVIKSWGWRIKKAGLTQEDVQEKTGVSQSMLSKYITGKTVPPLERYCKIEKLLKGLGV